MKKSLFITLFALTFSAVAAPLSLPAVEQISSSSLQWQTDFKAAKEQAAREKKPLLLFFTGSDWCGWCKKINSEILTNSTFQQKVKDQFIFVELDFPSKTAIDPALKKQNEELKKQFQVKGFPTLVLINYNNDPIGIVSYSKKDPSAYADDLLNLVKQYQSK